MSLIGHVATGPALAAHTGGDHTVWLTIDSAASVMFGGVPLPTARALMLAFAFMQAVHYAIWLDWIPRRMGGVFRTPYIHCIDRVRGTAPTKTGRDEEARGHRWFSSMSLLVVGTTAAVIGAALVDPAWTRATYLALATFHIYLELVVLAVMFARWRSARSPSRRRRS